jgi:hypothetical protein
MENEIVTFKDGSTPWKSVFYIAFISQNLKSQPLSWLPKTTKRKSKFKHPFFSTSCFKHDLLQAHQQTYFKFSCFRAKRLSFALSSITFPFVPWEDLYEPYPLWPPSHLFPSRTTSWWLLDFLIWVAGLPGNFWQNQYHIPFPGFVECLALSWSLSSRTPRGGEHSGWKEEDRRMLSIMILCFWRLVNWFYSLHLYSGL